MKLFRVSVKAFVRNQDNKVLLVRFSQTMHDPVLRGIWDLPGGGVEFGEDLDTAFQREIQEEIGGSVTKGDLITVWDWLAEPNPIPGKTYKSPDENEYHGIVLGFDAVFSGGEIKFNDEHDSYIWIDPENWHKFDTGFEKEKISKAWNDYLNWYRRNIDSFNHLND